jgi:hypothetical protein
MIIQVLSEAGQRARLRDDIGVEQNQIVGGGQRKCLIRCSTVASVLLVLDQLDPRELRPNHRRAAVGGGVVDDNDWVPGLRGESG